LRREKRRRKKWKEKDNAETQSMQRFAEREKRRRREAGKAAVGPQSKGPPG
jgi:hypothetical protein